MLRVSLLLLLLTQALWAEGQSYQFDLLAEQETYVPLAAADTLTDEVWGLQDEWSIPIGFEFSLLGSNFDSITIRPGIGGLTLDLPSDSPYDYHRIGLTDHWMSDFAHFEGSDSSQSSISYQVDIADSGSILKVEFSQCWIYNLEGAPTRITGQVWLHEESETVTVHYSNSHGLDDPIYTYVLGPMVTIWQNSSASSLGTIHYLTGNPDSPTLLTGDYDAAYNNALSASPTAGQRYTFSQIWVGLAEYQSSRLSVYPNPGQDYLMLDTDITGSLHIDLYKPDGKQVLTSQLAAGERRLAIDLSSGLYHMIITDAAQKKKGYSSILILAQD